MGWVQMGARVHAIIAGSLDKKERRAQAQGVHSACSVTQAQ